MAASRGTRNKLSEECVEERDLLAAWVLDLGEENWSVGKVQVDLMPSSVRVVKCLPLTARLAFGPTKAQLLRIPGPYDGPCDIREKVPGVTNTGFLIPLTETSNALVCSVPATSKGDFMIEVKDVLDIHVNKGQVVYLYSIFWRSEVPQPSSQSDRASKRNSCRVRKR